MYKAECVIDKVTVSIPSDRVNDSSEISVEDMQKIVDVSIPSDRVNDSSCH